MNAKRARVSFQDLASRVTGISLPVFGVSWNPPVSERQIVREAFVFLEDRRALYNDYVYEMEHEVAGSVHEIRRELTDALKRLPEESEATPCMRAMRAACREYLDATRGDHRHGGHLAFTIQLGRLRAMIGVQVAYLAVKYGIDLDGELLRVIPAEFRDATLLDG